MIVHWNIVIDGIGTILLANHRFPMRINLRDSNPVRGDMFIGMAQPNIFLAP
jgi:hypothetical protein